MVDLSNVQNLPLKVVFITHFIFISWGVQGYWSPDSYLFYNAFFLLTLLWSIQHKDSDDPLHIALIINIISILLDVIVLAAYFPESFRSKERFSVAMAILNLVVRPVTCIVLGRLTSERGGGGVGDIFGSGVAASSNRPRTAYDDLDNPNGHQSVPGIVPVDSTDSKQSQPYHG